MSMTITDTGLYADTIEITIDDTADGQMPRRGATGAPLAGSGARPFDKGTGKIDEVGNGGPRMLTIRGKASRTCAAAWKQTA